MSMSNEAGETRTPAALPASNGTSAATFYKPSFSMVIPAGVEPAFPT